MPALILPLFLSHRGHSDDPMRKTLYSTVQLIRKMSRWLEQIHSSCNLLVSDLGTTVCETAKSPLSLKSTLFAANAAVGMGHVLLPPKLTMLNLDQSAAGDEGQLIVSLSMLVKLKSAVLYFSQVPFLFRNCASTSFAFLPAYASENLHAITRVWWKHSKNSFVGDTTIPCTSKKLPCWSLTEPNSQSWDICEASKISPSAYTRGTHDAVNKSYRNLGAIRRSSRNGIRVVCYQACQVWAANGVDEVAPRRPLNCWVHPQDPGPIGWLLHKCYHYCTFKNVFAHNRQMTSPHRLRELSKGYRILEANLAPISYWRAKPWYRIRGLFCLKPYHYNS